MHWVSLILLLGRIVDGIWELIRAAALQVIKMQVRSTTQSTTNYVSSGNELGIQQSLSDEQKQTGKDVQGEEKDENADTVIEVLKFIKAYFEEGGSDENPLKVIMTNYVTGSSNIDDSGITFNGANRRNLIP